MKTTEEDYLDFDFSDMVAETFLPYRISWPEPSPSSHSECSHEWKGDTYFMSNTIYYNCKKCGIKKEDTKN